jgi:hypothetical protein
MIKIAGLSLVTAKEAASSLRGVVTAKRLKELAAAGIAPHRVVDEKGPFFVMGELESWIRRGLTRAMGGLPGSLPGLFPADDAPAAISQINGLKRIDPAGSGLSGVYFLCDGEEVVYIGRSADLFARIKSHCSTREKQFHRRRVYFIPVPEDHLIEVELEWIHRLKPKYNGRASKRGTRRSVRNSPDFGGVVDPPKRSPFRSLTPYPGPRRKRGRKPAPAEKGVG